MRIFFTTWWPPAVPVVPVPAAPAVPASADSPVAGGYDDNNYLDELY